MSTTITLNAGELERVLTNGILFAAPAKDCLPALEVVRFDWDGDQLLAIATNRYVLSYEQVEYHGNGNTEGRDSFSIGTGDARRVIALLKTVRLASFPVAVKYDSESSKVTFAVDGDTMIVSTEHGEFAQWRKLASIEEFKAAERDSVTLSAKWLGLLAKVKADNAPVRFEFTEGTKPVRVTIGEHFKAIIVPIKNAG